MFRTAFRLTMTARMIGIQCPQSPNMTVIRTPTPTTPMMMPATPELELGMQILSGLTTDRTGSVARHAYWPLLFAAPCAIVYLAFVAKGSDQAAEHVVCRPAQAGFVDQGEASDCQGDEREGRVDVHGKVSGWGTKTGKWSRRPPAGPLEPLRRRQPVGQACPARSATGPLGALGGAAAKQLDWGCSMPTIKGT